MSEITKVDQNFQELRLSRLSCAIQEYNKAQEIWEAKLDAINALIFREAKESTISIIKEDFQGEDDEWFFFTTSGFSLTDFYDGCLSDLDKLVDLIISKIALKD